MIKNFETMPMVSDAGEIENGLTTVLTRLEGLLAEENQILEAGTSIDHAPFIASKNQALRELMSIQKFVQLKNLSAAMLSRMKGTRLLVDRNHQLLKLQVAAMNDITAFLARSAAAEQGDGTYSRGQQ